MRTKTTDTLSTPWEMILLSLLFKEDMYGAQMAKEIASISNDKLKPLMGTMYPVLYKLTDEQCIEFYEKTVGRRSSVVYYHITKKGREKMKTLIKEIREHISVIKKFMSI